MVPSASPHSSELDLSALILAGGLGTRLRAVVADRPKVLAPVSGRPFIEWLLDQLHAAGVRHVIVSTGYRAEMVREALGDSFGELTLTYSQEPQQLGTGGAVQHALPHITSSRLLIMNGDSYCDVPLRSFIEWHLGSEARLSMVLTAVADAGRYGRVEVDAEQRITAFREKQQGSGPGLVNAGIYLAERSILAQLSGYTPPFSLEREVFPQQVGGRFFGFDAGSVRFIDIGTPESYAEAQQLFSTVSRNATTSRGFSSRKQAQ